MVNSMQSALASVERIYDMLDEPEISQEPALPALVERVQGKVEFRNVRFGYSPDRILMKDVSLSVRPGQKIAIVGSTGAGKTTLINLLMRFYEVNGGNILLDGKDIRTLSRANLRSCFGMVLQDTWLLKAPLQRTLPIASRMLPGRKSLRLQRRPGWISLYAPCRQAMIRF